MNRFLAAATALSLIAGAGLMTAPEAFAQAPATPAQKTEPAKKAEPAKKGEKADTKKSEKAKEKAKSGQPKTETKDAPKK